MRYVVLDMEVAIQSNRLKARLIDFKITSEDTSPVGRATEEVA